MVRSIELVQVFRRFVSRFISHQVDDFVEIRAHLLDFLSELFFIWVNFTLLTQKYDGFPKDQKIAKNHYGNIRGFPCGFSDILNYEGIHGGKWRTVKFY